MRIAAKILVMQYQYDDVIKWKHFPPYWSFVRGIHRSPFNYTHKAQWRGALMFSLICAWINGWVNNRSWGRLFETPSRSLWRHCNEYMLNERVQFPIWRRCLILINYSVSAVYLIDIFLVDICQQHLENYHSFIWYVYTYMSLIWPMWT